MARNKNMLSELVPPVAFLTVACAWGYVAFAYFAGMFAA